MNPAKIPTPPHYDGITCTTDALIGPPRNTRSGNHDKLTFIVSQGVSVGKLTRMAETGVDACFPQQFAIQIYKYNSAGERTAYTGGNGCLLWLKLKSLSVLSRGVYVRGEIYKVCGNNAQTDLGVFSHLPTRHRNLPGIDLLHPGTEIQFVHRGAMAEGPVYELFDPAADKRYITHVPEHLDCSSADRIQAFTSMVSLCSFASKGNHALASNRSTKRPNRHSNTVAAVATS